MSQAGYRNVSVLVGGLDAWTAAGNWVGPLADEAAGQRWKELDLPTPSGPMTAPLTADSAFLPRIAGQTFLEGRDLPLKREMVPLFVDMVGSTRIVMDRSAEQVLEILQAFMEVVIDIAAYHCGDVHDFEGDGALLYFEGAGEAVPAAFRLRDVLLERRLEMPELPLPRLSLDIGPVVVGIVGTRFRQTVALVGPAVHIAARILKLAPPGGIIATASIVSLARRQNPELGARFQDPIEAPDALREELGELGLWLSRSAAGQA